MTASHALRLPDKGQQLPDLWSRPDNQHRAFKRDYAAGANPGFDNRHFVAGHRRKFYVSAHLFCLCHLSLPI
jgi:hypothetical protein